MLSINADGTPVEGVPSTQPQGREFEKHKQSRKPWDKNAGRKSSVHDDGQDMEAPVAAEEASGFLGFGGVVLESFVGGCSVQIAVTRMRKKRVHPLEPIPETKGKATYASTAALLSFQLDE